MTICFVYGIFNNVLKNFFYFNVDLTDIYFHPAVPRFWYTIRCRYQGISLPMAGNFYNLAVNPLATIASTTARARLAESLSLY